MKYQELLILLPCHSLEDFPTYHEGDDADSLLACWTAMWHPALLASAGTKPTWARVDAPPAEIANRLLVVPTVAASQMPTGFAQRAKEEGATLVRRLVKRPEIVAAALAPLDGGDGGVPPDLAADFLALGYCYLQIQLLTRQMRYSSNLDELHFQNQVIAGARAAIAGDQAVAREKLTACFDMLAEERNHYYPVEAFVLDMTLVADTTIGASLRNELAGAERQNLVISGGTLERMSKQEPATLAALADAVSQGRAALLGGEVVERRWPLMGHESLAAELGRGAAVYRTLVGQSPTVFARRRFGITPMLPGVLTQAGFRGVLHATLDDGRFPQGSQLKVRWEGLGGAGLDAIARIPLDASKPQTFLSFAMKLGESMDADHVATLLLAHWPGPPSTWHEDLRRIARYTTALGKFVTIEDYFSATEAPSQTDRFDVGQYRSPYLKQAVIRKQLDPLSSTMRYWQRRTRLEAIEALWLMAEVAGGAKFAPAVAGLIAGSDASSLAASRPTPDASAAPPTNTRQPAPTGHSGPSDLPASDLPASDTAQRDPAQRQLENWASRIDQFAEEPESELERLAAFDTELAEAERRAAENLAAALPRSKGAASPGILMINPLGFSRRSGTRADQLPHLPIAEKPVVAADEGNGAKHLVAETPPLGYTWVASGTAPPPKPRRAVPRMAEDTILRNEFFEALLNPVTGSLQSIHEYGARANRLSQQLALRMPGPTASKVGETYRDPDETAIYSVMAVDKIEVTESSTASGELTTHGRLMDRHGATQARYVQRFRVWRGSRILAIDIELDPVVEPQADPWNSYYACRFAWNDESAELFRAVHQQRHAVPGKQFEAPHYIEIEAVTKRTTILTGGLPFHRRVGGRILDTLLRVRGERGRKFRVGIGIDATHPLQEAQQLLAPPIAVQAVAAPPSPASSWLFHCDAKSVTATHWEPLRESGRLVGFRVRLLETMGRGGPLKLSACRPLTAAKKLDLTQQPLGELAVANGQAQIEIAPYAWISVEGRWA
jgi:alpha-mannosidase